MREKTEKFVKIVLLFFEGELFNRLSPLKNKRRLKWRDKVQIYWKYKKPVFKARQNELRQWGQVQCH